MSNTDLTQRVEEAQRELDQAAVDYSVHGGGSFWITYLNARNAYAAAVRAHERDICINEACSLCADGAEIVQTEIGVRHPSAGEGYNCGAELTHLRNENKRLRDEIAERDERIRQLERDESGYRRGAAAEARRVDVLTKERGRLRHELAAARAEAEQLQGKVRGMLQVIDLHLQRRDRFKSDVHRGIFLPEKVIARLLADFRAAITPAKEKDPTNKSHDAHAAADAAAHAAAYADARVPPCVEETLGALHPHQSAADACVALCAAHAALREQNERLKSASAMYNDAAAALTLDLQRAAETERELREEINRAECMGAVKAMESAIRAWQNEGGTAAYTPAEIVEVLRSYKSDKLKRESGYTDELTALRAKVEELERELRESEAERETAANDRIAAQELHERELEAAKADVRRMREALQVMVDVFHPSRSADETEYIQTQAHEFARAALAAEE